MSAIVSFAHATRRITRGAVTRATFVAVLPLALGACASMSRPAPPAANLSLYQRLGGFEAIAAVTDDFLGRATTDPRIAPYFKGLEPRDLQRVRQHLVDQLCTATGGPCHYPGRDMKTVHAEMEINGDIWYAFTGHLNTTMDKFKVPDRERNELSVIIASLRPQIVNR